MLAWLLHIFHIYVYREKGSKNKATKSYSKKKSVGLLFKSRLFNIWIADMKLYFY